MDDGIALDSAQHPQRTSWLKRLRYRLFTPKLSEASLETLEIEIADEMDPIPPAPRYRRSELAWEKFYRTRVG